MSDNLSNPSAAQYQSTSQITGTTQHHGHPVILNGTHAGTLPFTGMDLALVTIIAIGMVMMGLGLRKLSDV